MNNLTEEGKLTIIAIVNRAILELGYKYNYTIIKDEMGLFNSIKLFCVYTKDEKMVSFFSRGINEKTEGDIEVSNDITIETMKKDIEQIVVSFYNKCAKAEEDDLKIIDDDIKYLLNGSSQPDYYTDGYYFNNSFGTTETSKIVSILAMHDVKLRGSAILQYRWYGGLDITEELFKNAIQWGKDIDIFTDNIDSFNRLLEDLSKIGKRSSVCNYGDSIREQFMFSIPEGVVIIDIVFTKRILSVDVSKTLSKLKHRTEDSEFDSKQKEIYRKLLDGVINSDDKNKLAFKSLYSILME